MSDDDELRTPYAYLFEEVPGSAELRQLPPWSPIVEQTLPILDALIRCLEAATRALG